MMRVQDEIALVMKAGKVTRVQMLFVIVVVVVIQVLWKDGDEQSEVQKAGVSIC